MSEVANYPAITVGFSTTKKFMSKLIRWITRSPVSHAWIAFDDETLGMRMVMQAETWGYEIRPWNRWCKENVLVAEFSIVCPRVPESLRWIATFLGTRYDYRAAILSGIWRWVKRWFKGRCLNDPTKLMCSEGVIRMLQDAECAAVLDLDPDATNPKVLLGRVLLARKEFPIRYVMYYYLRSFKAFKELLHE
jgi:hypothetical protein